MTKQLALTEAQVNQVKQVLDSHQAEETAKAQALKSAREALRQAAASTPVNEGAIRNAAAALGQAEGDSALLHARIHAQIVPVLNPEQQQKFTKFRESPADRWRSQMFGASN